MTSLLIIYLVISVLALIPTVLYVVRYHMVSRGAWKRHWISRSIMIKALVVMLLMGFVSFNTAWVLIMGQSYAARVPIGMGLFTAFAVALWWDWRTFEKIQKEQRKADGDE